MLDKHRSLHIFPLLLQFFQLSFFIFDLLSSKRFAADKTPCLAQAPIQPQYSYQSPTGRGSHGSNMARRKYSSMCQSTLIFFDSLVIFRHNFTGNRKVSCILATISDWFPKKFKNKSCVVVFSSYAQFLVALATSESQFRALLLMNLHTTNEIYI